jgi:hypothetical protein
MSAIELYARRRRTLTDKLAQVCCTCCSRRRPLEHGSLVPRPPAWAPKTWW